MEKKPFSVGEIKVDLKIENLNEFTELVEKANKESAQLKETIAQIQNFAFDINVDW